MLAEKAMHNLTMRALLIQYIHIGFCRVAATDPQAAIKFVLDLVKLSTVAISSPVSLMTILAAFVRDTLGHNTSALTDLFKLLQLQELGPRLFGPMLLSAFLESEHVQLAHLLHSLLAARKLAAMDDDCCVDGIEDLIITGLDSQYTCASGATPFASAACVMRAKLGTSTTRLARAFLSGVVVAYAHCSANDAVHGDHLHR